MSNFETNLQWVNFSSHIAFEARDCYMNNKECDVYLRVGGQSIAAHKIILSAASDFFKTILLTVPCYELAIILIPNIKFDLLKYAIEFIYTGESEVPSQDFNEFLDITINVLGLKSLSKNDVNIFETSQTVLNNVENVIEYDEGAFTSEYDLTLNEYSIKNEQQTESPEQKVNDNKSRKLKQKIKRSKKYEEQDKLKIAMKDIENGKTYREVSKKHEIPLSSLYAYTKQKKYIQRHGRPSLYDKCRIQEAVNSIIQSNLTYKRAENIFGIPKTILWRHVQKHPKVTESSGNPRTDLKLKAIKAIENGECLTEVCKKYDIAVSTLYREKRKLHVSGKLQPTSSIKIYKRGANFESQVKLAIEACQKGLSIGIASCLYNVPKTTIWRYLKKHQSEQTTV